MSLPEADWQAFCLRCANRVRRELSRYTTTSARAVETGRGEGGDMTLAIDAAAEDAVFAELDALGVGLLAVSEERGEVVVADGGSVRVVVDPVDGSLNAKRGLPFSCLSIAIASLVGLEAERVRALGSVALSLCLVAAGQLDAMASLRPMRSVDAAAAQLLVREAGGEVAFPDAGPNAALDLEMRSRVLAARDPAVMRRLLHAEF
jgi:fructose-1,6-bisphosphatase/inositol monophosphatase family enzyme